jgi:hypothetical protein
MACSQTPQHDANPRVLGPDHGTAGCAGILSGALLSLLAIAAGLTLWYLLSHGRTL